jgi:histidinol-phosphatase (PHP family)
VTYTSYHNHTTWSDGSSALPAMIESARQAGLTELGISDHYAIATGNPPISWALAPESLDAYVAEIRLAMESTTDIILRLGLEVDYFPETIEQTRNRLNPYSFDFLIGSVHFADDFPIDLEARAWEALTQDSRNQLWRTYWQRLRSTAQTGCFDVIGHFDLPKKFNFHPSVDLTAEALAALDAVAAADMAIEINTSGWDRPVGEAYPSLFYLQEANRRKIPLVINADAHRPDDVVRHFDRARLLARAAGYTEVVRFERRQRFSYPL